jgi:8-oxo-dGTP diphosphatase
MESPFTQCDGPALTVDGVVSFPDGRVVLIRRKNDPFQGMWALPGGFVEPGETTATACIREIKEECSIDIELGEIIGVYSDPNRDPRGHTVSVVFHAKWVTGDLKGDDDASLANLFTRDELQAVEMAFDHRSVLVDAGLI